MKKYYLFILLLSSCDQFQDSKINNKNKSNNSDDSTMKSIVGVWGDGVSPVWKVSKDSIYYYGRDSSYHCQVSERDLLIYLPLSTGRLQNIKRIEDTLFFEDELGPVRAYRIKKLINNK